MTEAGSGQEALAILESAACDAAIIDIRMPAMSGTELMELIRTRWPHTAVIMLTGHGTLESAMTAVRAGAHDYLLKPAQPEAIRESLDAAIVMSRRHKAGAQFLDTMRTELRHLEDVTGSPPIQTPGVDHTHRLEVGDLHIDLRAYEVRRSGTLVHLSPTEFKLLVTLASHPAEAVDYARLVELSLGYEAELWEAKELIKRHIFALRHKIEPDPAEPRYILNVRGVGYRLVRPS